MKSLRLQSPCRNWVGLSRLINLTALTGSHEELHTCGKVIGEIS